MRKLLSFFPLAFIFSAQAFGQIGIGTNTPDSSAMLELLSPNKGFLPARVALTATNVAEPVSNPATFLMVCNTATAGTPPYNVIPGYYYWTGSAWQPMVNKGENYGDMQFWNGTKWIMIPAGNEGDKLTWCNGKPQWGDCTQTKTYQPGPEGFDAVLDYKPGCNNGNVAGPDYAETLVSVWTYNGIGCGVGYIRYMVKFAGVDSIPAGATILSAKLSFYGVSSSPIAPQGNSNYPGSPYNTFGTNEILVKRITSSWDEATVTWNTQPASTSTNQVIIPASTSRWNYDAIDLNVTGMVQQMVSSGNYGFILQMQTEQEYRNMNFYSGDATIADKRPKLVVTYKL